jgi:hypothetical protein
MSPAWMPGLSLRFAVAHIGRHPFVPAGLLPVAQDIVHRPRCPIITGSGIAFR